MTRLLGLLIVTMLAGGVGLIEGRQSFQMISSLLDAERKQAERTPASPPPKASNVRELKPMITNLAAPPGMWVRLEAAIITDIVEPDLDRLAGEIATDTLGYLRTLSVADLAGAEGLRHLREDLGERASIRSNRRVREFIIETLVVQ